MAQRALTTNVNIKQGEGEVADKQEYTVTLTVSVRAYDDEDAIYLAGNAVQQFGLSACDASAEVNEWSEMGR